MLIEQWRTVGGYLVFSWNWSWTTLGNLFRSRFRDKNCWKRWKTAPGRIWFPAPLVFISTKRTTQANFDVYYTSRKYLPIAHMEWAQTWIINELELFQILGWGAWIYSWTWKEYFLKFFGCLTHVDDFCWLEKSARYQQVAAIWNKWSSETRATSWPLMVHKQLLCGRVRVLTSLMTTIQRAKKGELLSKMK